MNIKIHILPILLFTLLAGVTAPPLEAQAETESRSIRVAALDIMPGHDALWLRLGSGKEPVEIPLNTRVFSQPIEFTGAAALAFYGSAIDAGAKEPPPPLASTVLKSNPSLIVFSPAADQGKYETYTIAGGDFPFGSFRLVNFSTANIGAEFSGKSTLLKPGSTETLVFREAQNAIPVRILAVKEGSPPRLIRQSSWSIVPSQRELVLFFPNPVSGLVRLRHFVDTEAEATQVDFR